LEVLDPVLDLLRKYLLNGGGDDLSRILLQVLVSGYRHLVGSANGGAGQFINVFFAADEQVDGNNHSKCSLKIEAEVYQIFAGDSISCLALPRGGPRLPRFQGARVLLRRGPRE